MAPLDRRGKLDRQGQQANGDHKEKEVPSDQPEPDQPDQQLRARREQWEQREAPARRERREHKARQDPPDPQDRRGNRVQLARLGVADLLALLGLPVPKERRELRGKPVRPDHGGQQGLRELPAQPDTP
jgi:hypothetical protein